jgi:hypothetical protein
LRQIERVAKTPPATQRHRRIERISQFGWRLYIS